MIDSPSPLRPAPPAAEARTLGDRLEAWALWLDRQRTLIVALLAISYVVLVAPTVHRHLWYDELHTVYIAQATSMRNFIDEIRLLDLNPPLTYVLVRASMKVLGATELGARLPMMLGFFLGSMAMFAFIWRRAGALWAAAGVSLFWYNQSFYFASEARPYGILLACMGLTLVSWDYAADRRTSGAQRRWALAGVAVGAAAMLLTHVYAPLWLVPFWVGELVRSWRQRRIDWPLWAALVCPLSVCLTYIPLIQNVSQGVFPPEFQGSVSKAVWFYLKTFFQVAPPLLAGGLAAFGLAAWRRRALKEKGGPDPASQDGIQPHELAYFLVALLPPAILNAMAIRQHIAFYDRHAFLTTPAADLLFILFIAYESRTNRLSGFVAAVTMLGFTLFLPAQSLLRPAPPSQANVVARPKSFAGIYPELPVVANSAITFLEMDRYESPALVARLYYLVDAEASIKYAHSNLTEGLLVMKQYFPIRANVSTYADFVATNRHFLVWGEMDLNGWLLHKLKDEGAHLSPIGDYDMSYVESLLYDVRLDP